MSFNLGPCRCSSHVWPHRHLPGILAGIEVVGGEADELCEEETYSWRHFTPDQLDPYWIRCTLTGPHEEHEDEHTGLKWKAGSA